MIRALGAGGVSLILLGGPVLGACSDTKVEFRKDADGPVTSRFTVEVADDGEERALGLMHRETMPKSAGMIFIYDEPADNIAFWMRNTLIPLDMIFVGADGVIRRVHENAVPLDDKTSIPAGPDVQFVVEINGGLSSQLGIEPGMQMRHPSIDPDQAVWPCDE